MHIEVRPLLATRLEWGGGARHELERRELERRRVESSRVERGRVERGRVERGRIVSRAAAVRCGADVRKRLAEPNSCGAPCRDLADVSP